MDIYPHQLCIPHHHFIDQRARTFDSLTMEWIILTDDIREQLRGHQDQTGVGPMKLLRGRKDKPDGLTARIVVNWMAGTSKKAQKDHYDYMVALWEQQIPYERLSRIMISHFKLEPKRTGVPLVSLIRLSDDVPEGLTEKHLANLLNGNGRRIRQDYWDFLSNGMAALPDKDATPSKPYIGRNKKPSEAPKSPNLRFITVEEREEIEAHIERTGIYGADLLTRFAKSKPEGLMVSTIRNWRAKREKRRSNAKYISWILRKYRSLPDK